MALPHHLSDRSRTTVARLPPPNLISPFRPYHHTASQYAHLSPDHQPNQTLLAPILLPPTPQLQQDQVVSGVESAEWSVLCIFLMNKVQIIPNPSCSELLIKCILATS